MMNDECGMMNDETVCSFPPSVFSEANLSCRKPKTYSSFIIPHSSFRLKETSDGGEDCRGPRPEPDAGFDADARLLRRRVGRGGRGVRAQAGRGRLRRD